MKKQRNAGAASRPESKWLGQKLDMENGEIQNIIATK
jgi:hypothetical protein